MMRVIRTHGLLSSLRNYSKKLNYKKLLLVKLLGNTANLADVALPRSPCLVGLPNYKLNFILGNSFFRSVSQVG